MGVLKVWDTVASAWKNVAMGILVRDDANTQSEPSAGTLIFPDGTVLPHGDGSVSVREVPTGASFAHVTKNAGVQSIGAAWTKVTMDTVEGDSDGYFDNANDRLTIPSHISRGPFLLLGAGFSLGSGVQFAIYKNGNDWRRVQHDGTGGTFFGPLAFLDPDAGPGDYYELWAYNGGGAANVGHATVDSAETRLGIVKVGTGNVAGLPSARAALNAGTTTALSSTSYADFNNALDLIIPAQVGDVLLISLSALWVAAASGYGYLDAATIVSGSPVNYCGGGSSSRFGVQGWSSGVVGTSNDSPVGAAIQYVVQAGDISGGNVTLRLRGRYFSAARSIYTSADNPMHWSVVNLKGGARASQPWPSGTAFPTGPTSGQHYYRTDIRGGMLFVYDGTRWLSDNVFTWTIPATPAGAISSGVVGQSWFPLPADLAVYITRWDTMFRLLSPGAASWSLVLKSEDFAGTETTLATKTHTTADSNWYNYTDAIGVVVNGAAGNSGTNTTHLQADIVESSGTMTLVTAGQVYYRLIAT